MNKVLCISELKRQKSTLKQAGYEDELCFASVAAEKKMLCYFLCHNEQREFLELKPKG